MEDLEVKIISTKTTELRKCGNKKNRNFSRNPRGKPHQQHIRVGKETLSPEDMIEEMDALVKQSIK